MDLTANKKELSQKITDEMAGLFLLLLLSSSLFVLLLSSFVCWFVGWERGTEVWMLEKISEISIRQRVDTLNAFHIGRFQYVFDAKQTKEH